MFLRSRVVWRAPLAWDHHGRGHRCRSCSNLKQRANIRRDLRRCLSCALEFLETPMARDVVTSRAIEVDEVGGARLGFFPVSPEKTVERSGVSGRYARAGKPGAWFDECCGHLDEIILERRRRDPSPGRVAHSDRTDTARGRVRLSPPTSVRPRFPGSQMGIRFTNWRPLYIPSLRILSRSTMWSEWS